MYIRPITTLNLKVLRKLKGVFADIADTITTGGYLTPRAYNSLEKLQNSGLLVILVTGRSAGWCDHIGRMWPIDGVIGENGAFYFRYDKNIRKFFKRFMIIPENQKKERAHLYSVANRIFQEVPGTAFASDQEYRFADIAVDISEDVSSITKSKVNKIIKIMEEEGLSAKASSVHVNGWRGQYNKLTMTKIMMKECFSVNLDTEEEHFIFVGDSPNDQAMFKFFQNSVGVANVKSFKNQFKDKPKYVTKNPSGLGFNELVKIVVAGKL